MTDGMERAVEEAARALAANEGYAQPQKWNYEDARIVLTAALPLVGVKREDVARIIDPRAFTGTAEEQHRACSPYRVDTVRDHAFAKADAVLALLKHTGQPQEGFAPCWTHEGNTDAAANGRLLSLTITPKSDT